MTPHEVTNEANGVVVTASEPTPCWFSISVEGAGELRLMRRKQMEALLWALQQTLAEAKG